MLLTSFRTRSFVTIATASTVDRFKMADDENSTVVSAFYKSCLLFAW